MSISNAAGNSDTLAPTTEERRSSDIEKASIASSDTAADDDEGFFAPIRSITNSQYLPHLQAIEERLPGPHSGSLRNQSTGQGV